MIYCNLAGLMANKKVNISDVSKSTKISRTTLTSLYYNQMKGIQLDTANELCKYFNVSMDKLFMFSKYDITIDHIDFEPYSIKDKFLLERSADGNACISLLVESGNVSRICDICATLYFYFYSDSVSLEIDLGYYDSEDEDIIEENLFLQKVFETLNDEFKNHIVNLIVDAIVYNYGEQIPPEIEWDTTVSTDLW